MRFLRILPAALFGAFLIPPAFGAPEKLWSVEAERGAAFLKVRIIPGLDQIAALTITGVEFFDLKTGEAAGGLAPEPTEPEADIETPQMLVNERYVVVGTQEGTILTWPQYRLHIFDTETRAPLHLLKPPEDYPDHDFEILSGTGQLAGNRLLFTSRLRDRVEETDPLMLQYDLGDGRFIRAIGLMEMDANAKEGWFGARPEAPDDFFSAAITDGDMLYTKPLSWDGPEPSIYLGYDLETGETAPALPEMDGKEFETVLVALEETALYYALSRHVSGANVMNSGRIVRVDRRTGDILTTYEDPFAGKDALSGEFTGEHVAAGKPYAGSFFPGHISVSGGHVVATAPRAIMDETGKTGAIVIFDAESGEQKDILPMPGLPEHGDMTVHIDHRGDLLLVSSFRPAQGPGKVLNRLELYRLE